MYVKNISPLVDIYNNLLLTNIVFLSYGCYGNFTICNDVKKTLCIKLNVKNSLMWLIKICYCPIVVMMFSHVGQ